MRTLIANVPLPDPDTGETVWFGPGDDLPDWAAAAITNPGAWSDDPGMVELRKNTSDDPGDEVAAVRRAIEDPESISHGDLIALAAHYGLEPGTDFPARASRPVIAGAIAARLNGSEDSP